MPKLFIANVTKQIYQFAYRAPERAGVVVQTIPIGGQVLIAPNGSDPDLTLQVIEAIIAQHRKYGLVAYSELKSVRGPFHGICYQIDKPFNEDQIRLAMLKNEDMLIALGVKIRQEAALAVNNQIEAQIGAPLRRLEMSVEEREPRDGYASDLTHVSEGVRVAREPNKEGYPILAVEEGRRSRR
jgi:hypothetical protein